MVVNKSSLDEILKKGRLEQQLSSLKEEVQNGKPVAVTPELFVATAELQNVSLELKSGVHYLGGKVPIDGEFCSELSESDKLSMIFQSYPLAQRGLINAVSQDINFAVSKLGERGEALKVISKLLAAIDPVEIPGYDNIKTAHKDAFNAAHNKEDPVANFKEFIEPYKNTIVGQVVISLFPRSNRMQQYFIQGKSLEQALVNLTTALERPANAVDYSAKVYGASPDDKKNLMAYSIGKTLTHFSNGKTKA